MVTLTVNTIGLMFAGIIVLAGLIIPANDNGDLGIIWAIGITAVAAMAYFMAVGMTTMFG